MEAQLRRFRVNEPNVVFETFDEEIVAVNLDTGNYYSISGTGPMIWMDIAAGLTSEEIVDRVQIRHSGDSGRIVSDVAEFIDRLIGEKLIVESLEVSSPRKVAPEHTSSKTPFEKPVMEDYSDMQDLLMLDPIHDVDPAGWPVAKTNS
jgi:Coenzyme PQQ synthesis protein D (PqqD)